ncbi:hypothetical protein M3Y99_01431900 [Aphelenchoides fujianensis]|nr:hypothetical protein M3Y99_01431900 [Aphelenchoides fujianensis]
MHLTREELTNVLLVFTVLILLLACLIGVIVCLCGRIRCRRSGRRTSKFPPTATSSSYNPLIHSSKSDPLSLDIEFIDSPDAHDQPAIVSPTVRVSTLHTPR